MGQSVHKIDIDKAKQELTISSSIHHREASQCSSIIAVAILKRLAHTDCTATDLEETVFTNFLSFSNSTHVRSSALRLHSSSDGE